MDEPAEQIKDVIVDLCTGTREEQTQTLNYYFTPDAYFIHPFCRVPSLNNTDVPVLGTFNSRVLLSLIYAWYKFLSPEISIHVDSAAFDKKEGLLYVTIRQVFTLWFIPFSLGRAEVKLVTVLKLDADDIQPGKTRYRIRGQEDLYQVNEFLKFLTPPGGHYLWFIWQCLSTLLCCVGVGLFLPYDTPAQTGYPEKSLQNGYPMNPLPNGPVKHLQKWKSVDIHPTTERTLRRRHHSFDRSPANLYPKVPLASPFELQRKQMQQQLVSPRVFVVKCPPMPQTVTEAVACEKQMWARTTDFAMPLLTTANLKNETDIPALYTTLEFDEKLGRRVLNDLNTSPEYVVSQFVNPDVEKVEMMVESVYKEPESESRGRYAHPVPKPNDADKESDATEPDFTSRSVCSFDVENQSNDMSVDLTSLLAPNPHADEVVSTPVPAVKKCKNLMESVDIIDKGCEELNNKLTKEQYAIDISEPGHDPGGNGENDARFDVETEPYVKFVDVGGLKLPVNSAFPGGGHITGLGPILEESSSNSHVNSKQQSRSGASSAAEVGDTSASKSDLLTVDRQNASPKDIEASEHSAIKSRPGPTEGIDSVSQTPGINNTEVLSNHGLHSAAKATEADGDLPAIFSCSRKGYQKSTGRTPKKKKGRSRG